MVAPGVCIAATGSGMGKTTIATGLIAALARRMRVAPFKVGPDYIDPGYHTLAAGRQGRNLDAVLCGIEAMGPLYAHGCAGAELGVVEGVMGLFDGRISDGAGSTADVAAALGMPVILIVDVRGMSQSVGALVSGFASARSDVRIAGVILNQAGSDRHAAVCRRAVEDAGIPVVGVVPRMDAVAVPSRHLGLVTAAEHDQATEAVERMADLVSEHCDLDAIVGLAQCTYAGPMWDPERVVSRVGSPRIAVAAGQVFTFMYAEHEELLRACGAQVLRFDPLCDPLPECDALLIPGGFPEEHLEALAARTDLRTAVRAHVMAHKPIYGECAGLLWLLDTLDDQPMLGVIGTAATMGRRLTLGYRDAVALSDSVVFRVGERITGHEFHHTALISPHAPGWDAAWGWRGWDGKARIEGFVAGNVFASYLHIHPASAPLAVQRFVQCAADRAAGG